MEEQPVALLMPTKDRICNLFVVIMSVGGEDLHIDLGVEDAVNHAVLFRYLAAPAV